MNLDIQGDDDETLLETIHGPVARALSTHSTEILRTEIREEFLQTDDVIKKINTLFFLKELSDQDNADVIYQESCRIDDFNFQFQCFTALSEMQDVRALKLAEKFWKSDNFRDHDECFDDVIIQIEELQSPLSTLLLESWLHDTTETSLIQSLLLAIIQNDFGTDYQPFVPYLENDDEEIRNNALTVVMRRGKEKTVGILKKRLFDPLVSSEFKQDLLYHIAEQKLIQFEDVFIEFLKEIHYSVDSELWICAWANYTNLHARPNQPHENIVKNIIIPNFFAALDKYLPDEIGLIDQWLGTFMRCPPKCKKVIWEKMEKVYHRLTSEGKIELFQIMEANPEPYFSMWVYQEVFSENKDIRQIAAGVLAKIHAGKALKLKDEYPHILDELFRRSIQENILFYEKFYIDRAGNKHPYGFDGKIPVRIVTEP